MREVTSTAESGTAALAVQLRAWARGDSARWWLLPVALGLGARLVLAATLPIMFDEAWSIIQAVDLSADMFLGRRISEHRMVSTASHRVVPRSDLSGRPPRSAALRRERRAADGLDPGRLALPLYAGWNVRYFSLLFLLSAELVVTGRDALAGSAKHSEAVTGLDNAAAEREFWAYG